MQRKVTKAVFPVAGLGTRFLPATKSVPKEIMTLVDRPLIQYAIDEARAAGIKEFIFVTSRGKSALEDYFDTSPELEASLRKKGKDELLEVLQQTNMESGAIAYIRQHRALGLGHAVWCARRLIADEPFAVILPDDVIAGEKSCLQQMVEAYEETGGCMVAAMEVPPAKASAYGILDIESEDGAKVKVKAMVEKPKAEDAPSNLAVIGRYILTPDVMENLNRMKTGAGWRDSANRCHRGRDRGRTGRLWLPLPRPALRLRLKGGFPAGDRGLWPRSPGSSRGVLRIPCRDGSTEERRPVGRRAI